MNYDGNTAILGPAGIGGITRDWGVLAESLGRKLAAVNAIGLKQMYYSHCTFCGK